MSDREPAFVSVQSRGLIALLAELRRRHGLDQPGSQVEVVEREDGVIELRPHVAIPADQAWVWTPAWQEELRAADADYAAGRSTFYGGGEELLEALRERKKR